MDSYYLHTADLYDLTSPGLAGDVAFYAEEAARGGGPVLELGCGTGRTLLPLARAGLTVVGLDLAEPMLAIARAKVAALEEAERARIALVAGDMRAFDLGRRFRTVTIPYRAFLHLLTVEDQMRALARVLAHLAPDGRLILNIFDPRLDLLVADGGVWREQGVFTHPVSGRRVLVAAARRHDATRQVITERRRFEEIDADGRVVETRHADLALRWVYRYEMEHLLARAGFAVEALHGDFQRGPFRSGGEQIWIARPAGASAAQ
jgi:SAM-dependent methyltransferase